MKKLITIILCLAALSTNAQDSDTEVPDFSYLKFKRSKFSLLDDKGITIMQKVPRSQMVELLTDHPTAYNHYNTYRTFRTLKYVTRGIFAVTIVTAFVMITSDDYETSDRGWNVGIAGLGFMLAVQLPISIIAGSQAGKAVDRYNYDIKKEREKYSLSIGAGKNGIGLALNF